MNKPKTLIICEGKKSEPLLFKKLFENNFEKCEIAHDCENGWTLNFKDEIICIKSIPNGNVELLFDKLNEYDFSDGIELCDIFINECNSCFDVQYLVVDLYVKDISKQHPDKFVFLKKLVQYFEMNFIDDNTYLILNSPMLESIVDESHFVNVHFCEYKKHINELYKGGFINYFKKNVDKCILLNDARNISIGMEDDIIYEHVLNDIEKLVVEDKKLRVFNMISSLYNLHESFR